MATRLSILVLLLLGMVCSSATAAPATPSNHSPVVASQGNARVTLRDIDEYESSAPANIRQRIFDSPTHIESVIRTLLANKQLLNEARALKLDKQPAVIAKMQKAANGALIKARVDALRAHEKATMPNLGELAKERYLSDPSAYEVPRSVDVRHILIGTKSRSDAEAKALADKLHAELVSHPDQFKADVMKYSDDPSKASNQGLIPDAASDSYVKEFRVAAGKLANVGQISAPVKTIYGYHILKLVKATPAHKLSFDAVKPQILKKLEDDYVERKVRDHLDGIRSRKLDANMALVKSLTTRYKSANEANAKRATDTAAK